MIKQKNERALSTYCWLRRYWDVVMFRVLKELLWICLYDRGGNPFTGSISKRGGGMFEAFNPHTRCSDCTAISTIYGSILWPVDTCFYRCCMFVVLLRLDPIRIFLMWICHMLQTGCSWILFVLDFLFFFQIRLGHFWGKDWTYRFNERKEIFID